jgi:hypothetical protein
VLKSPIAKVKLVEKVSKPRLNDFEGGEGVFLDFIFQPTLPQQSANFSGPKPGAGPIGPIGSV